MVAAFFLLSLLLIASFSLLTADANLNHLTFIYDQKFTLLEGDFRFFVDFIYGGERDGAGACDNEFAGGYGGVPE